MLDALYRNSKVHVKILEPVKRIDGTELSGTVVLPRRAAERLIRINVAEGPQKDPLEEAMSLMHNSQVTKLNAKIPDFLYIDLAREITHQRGERKDTAQSTLLVLLRSRIPKVVSQAALSAIEESFKSKSEVRVKPMNEEESVLYRLVKDIVKMWIREIFGAANAFLDLGL